MSILTKYRQHIIIISLVIIGFLLRIIYQPQIPYGFHRDEAGIAYSAYSILQTGKDEWGRFLPLHFKALGDYPPGIYNYLVVLSIPIFGLTELAERMPAIILGTLMIPLVYIFVKKFFHQDKVALITAVLVTFSPWMVVQSRSGSEALTALFFSLIGFLFFKSWIEKEKILFLMGNLFFYFLSIYSYNAAKLVLPLLHLILIYYFWPKIKANKIFKNILLVIFIFILSFGSVFITHGNQMSFNNTSIFTNPLSAEALQVIFNREGVSGMTIFLSRIFTNKFTNLGLYFGKQYFDYFTFGFLFNDAGFHKRYLVPQIGPLLFVILPFLIWGVIEAKINHRDKSLIILWILVSPLAGAITNAYVPNLKRSMYLFLPLLILTAFGFSDFLNKIKKRKYIYMSVIIGIFLAYSWNIGYFIKQYVVHTKYETTQHRSYGYKEVFAYAKELESNFDQVKVFESLDTPHTFYLFYNQYPPQKYQAIPNHQKRDLFSLEKPVVSIDNYEFHPATCPEIPDLKEKVLYITQVGCFNSSDFIHRMKILRVVKSPDEMPLFYLSQVKKIDESPSNQLD